MKIKFTHIRLLLGFLVLVALGLSIDFGNAITNIGLLNVWILALLIFLSFISIIPRTIRWIVLLNDAGPSGVTFIEAFKFQLIGAALNLVLPAGGGDVAKGYFAFKLTQIKERMLSVSILDKLIAIASIAVLSLAVFGFTLRWEFIVCAILAVIPICIFFMHETLTRTAWINRIEKKVMGGWMGINTHELKKHMKFSRLGIFQAFLYSVIGWLIDYCLLYFCFIALVLPIMIPDVVINGPLLTLGRLFPFTLNGLGTDEALMVFLFKKSNPMLVEQMILIAALLYRVTMLIVPALPGLYYLYFWKKKS